MADPKPKKKKAAKTEDTPVEVVETQTVVEETVETPVETVKTTVEETPAEAPVEKEETPTEAPVEKVEETPTEAPVEKVEETPAEAPVEKEPVKTKTVETFKELRLKRSHNESIFTYPDGFRCLATSQRMADQKHFVWLSK